jgi:hypothetical protein
MPGAFHVLLFITLLFYDLPSISCDREGYLDFNVNVVILAYFSRFDPQSSLWIVLEMCTA